MPTTYRLTVMTGNIENAGTDANVFVTLFGTNGNSGERLLDNSEDNHEQGKVDLYSIEMRDIGEIRFVRIRHDNTGEKPGWFLDRIIVHKEDTDQEWVFPCGRWLAFDEDDHQIARVLDPA